VDSEGLNQTLDAEVSRHKEEEVCNDNRVNLADDESEGLSKILEEGISTTSNPGDKNPILPDSIQRKRKTRLRKLRLCPDCGAHTRNVRKHREKVHNVPPEIGKKNNRRILKRKVGVF